MVTYSHTMILIYIVFLIRMAYSREVSKSIDEIDKYNVTTLYPVKNIKYYVKERDTNSEQKFGKDDKAIVNNVVHKVDRKLNKNNTTEQSHIDINNRMKSKLKPNSRETHVHLEANSVRENRTVWNVDTFYGFSKINESGKIANITELDDSKLRDDIKSKRFKPSPHLGSYYDDNAVILPPITAHEFFAVDKPSAFGFSSFPKDFVQLQHKKPQSYYPSHLIPPYKYENDHFGKGWNHDITGLEPQPTVQAPTKTPAGGLYQQPNAFKVKPSSDGDDDNFGLEFHDEKEMSDKKKRGNPWKSLLNIVTSLVPVGIIVSALTPSIITLENVNNNPQFLHRASRSLKSAADLPAISERCKRRLLCELQSDANYIRNIKTSPQPKHCYKVHCEDTEALTEVLHWLLYRNKHLQRFGNVPDRRGTIT